MLTWLQKMVKFLANKKRIIFFIIILLCFITLLIILLTNNIKEEKKYCSFSLENSDITLKLPTIIIDTKGVNIEDGITKKTVVEDSYQYNIFEVSKKYDATFTLIDSCSKKEVITSNIKISLRGQSSLTFSKKQYALTFYNDDVESNVSLLGMPSNSKWVLNGTYIDKSLIRNSLAYQIGTDVMGYAPRTEYVEVFLKTGNTLTDASYLGVYTLIEKIERDPNRVDIKKSDDRYNDVSFIIARDKVKYEDIVYNTEWEMLQERIIYDALGMVKLRSTLKNVYPGTSNISDSYKQKIKDYINDFEDTLYSSDYKDKKTGYLSYIDLNSFIDMAMINEIFKNIDGCEVSTYFYKDIGGKLYAGPIWDFDMSLANTKVEEVNEPTGFRMVNTIWFNRMFQDPYFVKMYKQRYEYLRKTTLTDEKLLEYIDNEVKDLNGSYVNNTNRWYKKSDFNYEDEINEMKEFLIKRVHWIDENINNIKRVEDVVE